MLTKGEIVSIDYAGSTCKVHVPYFDGTVGGDPFIEQATIITQPGIYGGYKVGDIVVVGFEDKELSRLIVLGKLFTGIENETEARGTINCQSLKVETKTNLPADTNISSSKNEDVAAVEGSVTDSNSNNLVDIINRLTGVENNTFGVASEVSYLTTAPTINNDSGNLKFVVLASEPTTYYDGYIYYITEE